MPGGTVIITSPPSDSGGGSASINARVKVEITYDPPDFMDAKAVKRVTKQLQKAADSIVAKFG